MSSQIHLVDLKNAGERRRYAALLCGVLSAVAVWVTSLGHVDHQSLTAHMIQHLVLMTVSAPLILLGAQHRLMFVSVKPRLSTLLLCWLAGTVCVIGWHVPGVFEFGQRTVGWHEFELATFLAAGLLFWWPLLRHWRNDKGRAQWFMVLYLFLATLPCDALSAFLAFCGRPVYASADCVPGAAEGLALRDQEVAGALMWAWVTFAYALPAAIIAIRILSGERRPKRLFAVI